MKLHYPGSIGGAFGWGVFGDNITRELAKHCELVGETENPDVVLQVITDHDFNPLSKARGQVNLAMTFFEYPLGPNVAEQCKRYKTVFCGSTWCKERLAEIGVTNTKVLIQGVDHEIFCPRKTERFVRTNGSESITGVDFKIDPSFRIFSGGKFEYRKGQDIVIAAFREFLKTHPEAHLVCAWFNPWPNLFYTMWESQWIKPPVGDMPTQEDFFKLILIQNGIPESNFTVLPQLSQPALADVMRSTDLGVFPNRCEGGTNLVLMEYMSCGKPVVASVATGHKDVLTNWQSYLPIWGQSLVGGRYGWFESDIRSTVNALEAAIDAGPIHGEQAANSMKQWTWERAARTILEEV